MSDLSVTVGEVLAGVGDISHGTAGEAVTAGAVLYLKAADGKLWLAVDTSEAVAEAV